MSKNINEYSQEILAKVMNLSYKRKQVSDYIFRINIKLNKSTDEKRTQELIDLKKEFLEIKKNFRKNF